MSKTDDSNSANISFIINFSLGFTAFWSVLRLIQTEAKFDSVAVWSVKFFLKAVVGSYIGACLGKVIRNRDDDADAEEAAQAIESVKWGSSFGEDVLRKRRVALYRTIEPAYVYLNRGSEAWKYIESLTPEQVEENIASYRGRRNWPRNNEPNPTNK